MSKRKKADREMLDMLTPEHERRLADLERIVNVPAFSFDVLVEQVRELERQHVLIVGDMQRLVNEVNAQLTLRSAQPEPQLLIPHQGPAA